MEISEKELTEYKTAVIDLELSRKDNTKLEAKNAELSKNFKNAKLEAKTKNHKKLLEVVTEKETIENKLKVFEDTLNIGEVEDLKAHLENLNSDINKYGEIKEKEEVKTKEEIKGYTDFLNEKDENYLTGKKEIFGEDIVNNLKALKDFAEVQGFKKDNNSDTKQIKVGELKNKQGNLGKQDGFENAYQSGDTEAMTKSLMEDI